MTLRLIATLLSIFIAHGVALQPTHADSTEVLVESLLSEITRTLVRVRDGADAEELPPLTSANLKIQSEFKASGGGGFSLWVIHAKAKVSRLAVQTLDIELSPPEPVDGGEVSDISDALAEAILAAATAARTAADGDPPLRMSSVKATIRFVVEKAGSAGIKLMPITGELAADVSGTATQEISLRFSSP